MKTRGILVVLTVVTLSKCQDTAKAVLAPQLRECYDNPDLLNRNNLPPTTLPVLIEIIRKIEDYPGTVASIRQLSTGILHMFRQDGIVYDPGSSSTGNILPYGPTGFQTYKNRLLLNKMLPNNQFRFPNDSLTLQERCALHNMISSSIAMESRGDESIVCPQVTQISRIRRSKKFSNADVEVFNLRGAIDPLGRQIIGTTTCPLERGVVSTKWGPVAAGPLIAGIASALEPQKILISDLVRIKDDFIIDEGTTSSNIHSSTLAGDLAEAAMRQGTKGQINTIGAAGFWNSTSTRRHYFLNKTENLEITDAEIRGGIDGLILGDLGSFYEKNTFSNLKLSQLLEMYYSEKGTMHDARFKACLRRSLITSVTTTQNLIQETFGFSVALYTTMPLQSTLTLEGVNLFVNNTVNNFYSYVAQSINDPPCADSCCLSDERRIRPRINLILVSAATAVRYPHLSYLLEEIDISTHGSSVTLLNPQNGDTLIDKTHSLSTFHMQFVKIATSTYLGSSLNLTSVLQSIRSMASANVILETANHYSGGNSTVVLFLVDNVPATMEELRDCSYLVTLMRQQTPDLRLIFATTPAAQDSLQYIIRDEADFIPLTLSAVSESAQELDPIVTRLRKIPRRILNPLCSTHWLDMNSGTVSFNDYVDADGINLYSVHPNYFYKENSARSIRIQNAAYGTVSVCYSRMDSFPRRNNTSSSLPAGVTCESVTPTAPVEVTLAGACEGYPTIEECPPLYLTVSSTTTGSQPQCIEAACRLPNDLKYTVVIQQLGCYSGDKRLIASYIVITACLLFTIKLSL